MSALAEQHERFDRMGAEIVTVSCDTQFVLPRGTSEEVTADVRERVSILAPDGGFLIEVSRGELRKRVRWDGADDELVIRLGSARSLAEPIALDVCFVIDTTGSMRDEIARMLDEAESDLQSSLAELSIEHIQRRGVAADQP